MNTQTNDIHGSVMLVELNVSQWTARKQDKRISNAVAASNNVDEGVGTYYKSLLDPEVLRTIQKHVRRAKTYYYEKTLPWSDEGPRVLPTSLYFDFMEVMSNYREEFEQLVNGFLTDYPYHREESKRFLGNLFSENDYPEPDQLAHKFGFHLRLLPLPKGEDFRCDLGAEEVDKVKAQIEQQTTTALQESVRAAYQRVFEVAARYADRLSDPKNIFRDSMVEGARDLADILPALNFTGDPELERLTNILREKLAAHEPEQLRGDTVLREQTAAAAKNVVSDIESIFGGNIRG